MNDQEIKRIPYIDFNSLTKLNIAEDEVSYRMLHYAIYNNDKNVFKYLLNKKKNIDFESMEAKNLLDRIIRERKNHVFPVIEKKMNLSDKFDLLISSFCEGLKKENKNDLNFFKMIEKHSKNIESVLSEKGKHNVWHRLCVYQQKDVMFYLYENKKINLNISDLISVIRNDNIEFFEEVIKNMSTQFLQTGNRYSMNAGQNVLHVICKKIEEDFTNGKELNPLHERFFELIINKDVDLNIEDNSGKNFYSYRLPKNLLGRVQAKLEKEKISQLLNNKIPDEMIKRRL